MTFPGINVTFDLKRLSATPDDGGGPVADWQTVRSGVSASRQPHRPKLHGEEHFEYGQTILAKINDYHVPEILPEIPAGAVSGWAVAESDGRFARVVYVEEYPATGGVDGYMILRCEELTP